MYVPMMSLISYKENSVQLGTSRLSQHNLSIYRHTSLKALSIMPA